MEVENYFTDSLLHQDSLETNENLQPEEPDSGNEADTKPEVEEKCMWELNPLVTSINKLDVNNNADEIGVKNLEEYGDSKLIVNQVRGEYEVRDEDLVPYYNATIHMAMRFKNFYIDHVPRQQNAHADALASLAASLALPAGVVEKILVVGPRLQSPGFRVLMITKHM